MSKEKTLTEKVNRKVLNIEELEAISEQNEKGESVLPKETDTSVRSRMLISIANNAEQIYRLALEEEKNKKDMRNKVFKILLCLLIVCLFGFGILIGLHSSNRINLDAGLFLAITAYLISNLMAMVYIVVKYIHDPQYLNIFKIISSGLLSYLSQYDDSKENIKK